MTKSLLLTLTACLFAAQALAESMQGRLEWTRRVELATTVNGVVAEVTARVGQFVPKGEVLAQLETEEYEARALATQAGVERAEAAFEEAQREWERAEELYERTVLSDHELREARIAFAAARADRDQALAERMEAEVELRRTRIIAPFDALVLAVSAVPGQVTINRLRPQGLVTVADGRRMAARLTVAADRLGALAVGKKVPVTVAGRTYQGAITEVGLEPVEPGRYPVVVAFAFGRAALRAGELAEIELP